MDQDWETVVVKKKLQKPKDNDDALRQARQQGQQVDTVKKFNAGTNKTHAAPSNAKKLEEETEEFAVEHVSKSLSLRIQQARQAAGLTQKELAQKINEKATVINDYESGKALPNQQIISKLERALNAKLRGK